MLILLNDGFQLFCASNSDFRSNIYYFFVSKHMVMTSLKIIDTKTLSQPTLINLIQAQSNNPHILPIQNSNTSFAILRWNTPLSLCVYIYKFIQVYIQVQICNVLKKIYGFIRVVLRSTIFLLLLFESVQWRFKPKPTEELTETKRPQTDGFSALRSVKVSIGSVHIWPSRVGWLTCKHSNWRKNCSSYTPILVCTSFGYQIFLH